MTVFAFRGSMFWGVLTAVLGVIVSAEIKPVLECIAILVCCKVKKGCKLEGSLEEQRDHMIAQVSCMVQIGRVTSFLAFISIATVLGLWTPVHGRFATAFTLAACDLGTP